MFVQDIEKEVRKEVDDAIAQAKVPTILEFGYNVWIKIKITFSFRSSDSLTPIFRKSQCLILLSYLPMYM